jgi:hypothetical protein
MACNFKHATVIPLKPDSYDKSSIHQIKHSQSRYVAKVSEKTAVKVPRLSEDANFSGHSQKEKNYSMGAWAVIQASHNKFHMDLKPGTVQYHRKQRYSIHVNKIDLAKEELECRYKIGVIQKVYTSPNWAYPCLLDQKRMEQSTLVLMFMSF